MPDFKDTIYTDKPHQYQATHVRQGLGEIVTIDPVSGDGPQLLAHGPRLRDALLEAFPLRDEPAVAATEEPLADWEKELLAGVKPIKQYGSVVKPAPTPGTVWRSRSFGHTYITLPGDKVFVLNAGFHNRGDIINYDLGIPANAIVVLDPRDAVALPSPLGIRVGDRVRKTKDGVTISFEVGHIEDGTGHIFAKGDSPNFPVAFNPKGFEVTSREVPDRLPAGTIVRWVRHPERLRLITDDGGIYLTDDVQGPMPDKSDYDRMVREGAYEVIYLPES